eukprot:m.27116 g.27116  ORF g.27116 m.27116 type:complete len:51 (+) comp10171_c0_seq1:474-626(+)
MHIKVSSTLSDTMQLNMVDTYTTTRTTEIRRAAYTTVIRTGRRPSPQLYT